MRPKEGAKIELQREICQICQMLIVRDSYLNFSSDSMPFSRDFCNLNRWMDGQTDRPSYRDECTHLKRQKMA